MEDRRRGTDAANPGFQTSETAVWSPGFGTYPPEGAGSAHSLQGLADVLFDVLDVLDPHRHPHQVLGDAGR